LSFINQFDNSITKLTAPLTVGSIFTQTKSKLDDVPDEDYSLVCVSQVFSKEEGNEGLLNDITTIVARFLDNLNIVPIDGLTSFQHYAETFGVKPLPSAGIRGISTVAFQLKQSRWAIMGADLLSLLQALCDPLHNLTIEQIASGSQLALIWRANLLVAKLILLRAFGGYRAEQEFYLRERNYFSAINRSVLRIADSSFALNRSEGSPQQLTFAKNFYQSDPITQLLTISANVALDRISFRGHRRLKNIYRTSVVP
jgi:hypothetical protein